MPRLSDFAAPQEQPKQQFRLSELTQTPEQRQKLAGEMTHPTMQPPSVDVTEQPIRGVPYAKPGKVAAALQGVTKGVQDIDEAIRQTALDVFGDEQAANEFTKKVNERRQAFEQGIGQSKYAQAGRTAGKIAPALAIPGGQSLAARTAIGAGTGGAIGFGGFKSEETQPQRMEQRKKEGIAGVTIGAAIPLGLKGLGTITSKGAKRVLRESAPTSETLKNAAGEIYKDIDNLGATVNPGSVSRLGEQLISLAKKEGIDRTITPKAFAALGRLSDFEGPQTVSNLETLRKIFKSAASSIEPSDARLGRVMVDKIDDFMDSLSKKDFIGPKTIEAGKKLKEARTLWQRAKKGDILDEAFEKARNQASGFENGIRVQFRSILNNKRKLRGFTPDEIAALRKVVRGGGAENLARAIGKFGFTEGQASSMLLGSLGVAGGAAVGGAPGAVAVPLIGQVSKKVAQKLTRNNAELANAIVRAGNNGKKIVKEYMRLVPKSERSGEDLAQLLLKQHIPQLKVLAKQSPLINDAVFIATLMQMKDKQ